MNKFIPAVCCLFFIGISFGASISGFVTDASSGEPLPYADVYFDGEPFGASTNDNGFYLIEGVDEGTHKMIASYLGYSKWTEQVVVTKSQRLLHNIELEPAVEIGEEVIVEARREGGETDLLTGHLIVSQPQIKYMPQIFEADLFRTMHLLPGIVAKSDFSSALYIWGGTPAQNLVTIDGIEIYNANHLGGAISAFNVDALKEVNLIKGGFPAKWGGRIGSVLEIINREGDRNNIHGSSEISLLSTHGTLYGPFPKALGSGAWMLSARRTYFDLITALMKSQELIEDDLPYHFTDFHTKVTKDLQKGDKFSLSFYHGADIFDFEEEDEIDNDQIKFGWGNNTVSANYMHLFSPKHFGHFMLAYSQFHDEFKTSESGHTDEMMEDVVRDFTARGILSTAYPKHTLDFGLEIKYLSIMNKIQDMGYSEPLWNWDNQTVIFTLYGQDQWNPNPLWRIEYGLRNELSTEGPYFRTSPRASLMRRIDDKTRLKLSVGLYYQYFQSVPKFEEFGLSLFDTWVLSQEDLPPSWATHFVLRGETEKFKDIPISLDIYYKQMGNLYKHKAFYTPSGRFADLFDTGDGWAIGADILARLNSKQWSGWISYSFGLTVNTFDGIDNGEPFYPKHDRRHGVSVFIARDLGSGWTWTTTWSLSSGMPYTEALGSFYAPEPYQEDLSSGWWYEYEYYGGFHNMRVPTYHRLDLAIAKRYNLDWIDIEWFFQLYNAYYQKNVYTYFYDIDEYGNLEKEPMHMLPIIPTFGVRGWF